MPQHETLALDPRALGRRLQEARKARGLTQQDAAESLAVARTTITAIEKGDRQARTGRAHPDSESLRQAGQRSRRPERTDRGLRRPIPHGGRPAVPLTICKRK